MLAVSPAPIPSVIHQHAEESAILRHTRSVLVHAPHVKLHHLARLDERIAAHLDGLAVVGEYGSEFCEAALETPKMGTDNEYLEESVAPLSKRPSSITRTAKLS